jgi:aminopeptidase YwaD
MDMVGGGPETKAVFHVTGGPMSLPSFVHDVAWAFAEWVNEESYKFAATGISEYPMVAPEGGKEPLRAEYSAYTIGSDHDVYQDSSFGIPAIYLNDWPDRFIHTNLDSAANIDATKLKRAGFIGAASGYFLAGNPSEHFDELFWAVKRGELIRREQQLARARGMPQPLRMDAETGYCRYEPEIDRQLDELKKGEAEPPREERRCFTGYPPFDAPEDARKRYLISYRRLPRLKGPMAVFGFDYFEAEWTKRGHTTKPKLLEYEGLWGGGEEYAYEVLNFADGKRNAQEIRDAAAAEYGPVPVEMVVEYLRALEKIGVVSEVK